MLYNFFNDRDVLCILIAIVYCDVIQSHRCFNRNLCTTKKYYKPFIVFGKSYAIIIKKSSKLLKSLKKHYQIHFLGKKDQNYALGLRIEPYIILVCREIALQIRFIGYLEYLHFFYKMAELNIRKKKLIQITKLLRKVYNYCTRNAKCILYIFFQC